MALTTAPKACGFVYTIGGTGSAPIVHGLEKASSAWKAGDFLQDDDSGLITLSASPIDASAVTKRCFGLALADATGTTSHNVDFIWITSAVVLEGTLSDATAGTHTLAATDQWKVYPITKQTTFTPNTWYLDANAVSDTGGGIVIAFKDPVGTVDGRVYFVVTNTARGGANAGSGTY